MTTMKICVLAAMLTVFGADMPHPPSFEYVGAVSCGDVVMAWNKNNSEVLSITLRDLAAASRQHTFNLNNPTRELHVRVDAFEGPEGFAKCGDLGTPLTRIQDTTSGWFPTAGRLTVSVDTRGSKVVVSLRELVVQSINRDRVFSKRAIWFSAPMVGMAG